MYLKNRIEYTCTSYLGCCFDNIDLHVLSVCGVGTRSVLSTPTNQQDIGLQTLGNRGSLVSTASSASKPNALVTLAGFISETTSNKENVTQKVKVCNYK